MTLDAGGRPGGSPKKDVQSSGPGSGLEEVGLGSPSVIWLDNRPTQTLLKTLISGVSRFLLVPLTDV